MTLSFAPDYTPLTAAVWSQIFGNDRPVAIEIGPGVGEFLAHAAAAEPGVNFYAIEHLKSRVAVVEERLAEHRLANARVVCAAAECVLQLLPDDCVDRYYIQFPDPWWKRRHHRRRLMTRALVAHLRRTLRPGGGIEFLTDVEEYFGLAMAALEGDAGLVRCDDPALPVTTSFSRKAAVRGWRMWAATFRKRA